MTTTLITGATRGAGFENARRLAEVGHTFYPGVRDLTRIEPAVGALGSLLTDAIATDRA